MADSVVNTENTFDYITIVIENYSKETKYIKFKLKLSYYLKMFISLFLPVAILIFKQKELIALVTTAIITMLEFYLKFNRYEEKLKTMDEATSFITMHNELYKSGLTPYNCGDSEAKYLETMIKLIHDVDLKTSNEFNFKAENVQK